MVQSQHNGLTGVGGKYSGLLGFHHPPPDVVRSQASSPDRNERPPSRENEMGARGLWDLHFERKAASDQPPPREDLLPANREGLAA